MPYTAIRAAHTVGLLQAHIEIVFMLLPFPESTEKAKQSFVQLLFDYVHVYLGHNLIRAKDEHNYMCLQFLITILKLLVVRYNRV